jgi:hypothetical protein
MTNRRDKDGTLVIQTELRYEELARAKMIEWLAGSPDYLLSNLTMTNLGLDAAIRVIAEFVGKRVALGDFEETAWNVALDALGGFLEDAGCPDGPTDFAIYMRYTCRSSNYPMARSCVL